MHPCILVVEGDGPSHFGRDWLAKICLDGYSVNAVESGHLFHRHTKLFEPELVTLKGYRSQAYQQLELKDDAKKYVVINIHRGLYEYNWLPCGISSVPGIFQCVMKVSSVDLLGLDNTFITGQTWDKHLTLDTVLRPYKCRHEIGKDKCVFLTSPVEWLEHWIVHVGHVYFCFHSEDFVALRLTGVNTCVAIATHIMPCDVCVICEAQDRNRHRMSHPAAG